MNLKKQKKEKIRKKNKGIQDLFLQVTCTSFSLNAPLVLFDIFGGQKKSKPNIFALRLNHWEEGKV